jgi:hypothetical protein
LFQTGFLLLLPFTAYSSDPSLHFDGIDDLVTVTASPSLNITTEISIEAWIFWKGEGGISNFQGIVTKEPSIFHIAVGETTGNSKFVWALRDVSTTSPDIFGGWHDGGQLTRHAWTHVALTYDGTTVRTYLNGDLATSFSASGNIRSAPSEDVRIGGRKPTLFPSYFNGYIDEVRIWNVHRTTTEIRENMFTELTGSETGLVLHQSFNEGSGQTTVDSSLNGNDGRLGSTPDAESSDPDWGPGILGQNPLAVENWSLNE